MVPAQGVMSWDTCYSPRIRGDGPAVDDLQLRLYEFSPYSRGWSGAKLVVPFLISILPVFAGMVPRLCL